MFQITFESLSLSWVGEVDGNGNFPWAIGACRPGLAAIVLGPASHLRCYAGRAPASYSWHGPASPAAGRRFTDGIIVRRVLRRTGTILHSSQTAQAVWERRRMEADSWTRNGAQSSPKTSNFLPERLVFVTTCYFTRCCVTPARAGLPRDPLGCASNVLVFRGMVCATRRYGGCRGGQLEPPGRALDDSRSANDTG